jgi:hypothetical protein
VNQLSWTYLADNGKQHFVGLAHGAESGHLVVHCNSKVVLIDFKVFENASYSIFIDEQLCEISIEKQNEEFFYSFEIDNQADTPRNRARKKLEKQHLLQSIAFLGALVLIVSTAIFGISRWTSYHDQKNMSAKLQRAGQQVSARILVSTEESVDYASYYFVVNGKSYSTATTYSNKLTELLPNGMPLEKGDEFLVTYIPGNPSLNQIDFQQPTAFQINRYRDRVFDQLVKNNPSVEQEKLRCLLDQAYKEKGVEGLAQLYFQKTTSSKNSRHNRRTFERLLKEPSLQKAITNNCGEISF